MKKFTSQEFVSSILIMLGFVTWISCTSYFRNGVGYYVSGMVIFFIIACFIPETKKVTLLSRQSVLTIIPFFVWTGSTIGFIKSPFVRILLEGKPLLESVLNLLAPIILAAASYWGSLYLIRGFRAAPEYKTQSADS